MHPSILVYSDFSSRYYQVGYTIIQTLFLPSLRILKNILTSIMSFFARQAFSIIQTNDLAMPHSWCTSKKAF